MRPNIPAAADQPRASWAGDVEVGLADKPCRIGRPVHPGPRGAGHTAPAGLAGVARPRESVNPGVAGFGRRLRSEAAPWRVAQHLVALVDAVAGDQRSLAVLTGVDDEMNAAERPGDALPVCDFCGRPVEVGRVQEKALRLVKAT